MIFSQLFDQLNGMLGNVFYLIYVSVPFWGVFIFGYLMVEMWLRYIRADYIFKQGSLLLELKLPKEINKSPRAMEIFFSTVFQQGGVGGLKEVYWDGRVKPFWSFELVSIGGQVKFYIWTHKKWKHFIETQLYAQYPQLEIYDVTADDYAKKVFWDPVKRGMWGTYFKKSKDDVFPVKTYIDYELDKDPKEEFKIDPMTSMIEYLGGLKEGEQAWFQILVQPHSEENFKGGQFKHKDPWDKKVIKAINTIRQSSLSQEDLEKKAKASDTRLSSAEKDKIKAMERHLGKIPYDVVIRAMYIAEEGHFDAINISAMIGAFRQYSSPASNGISLGWNTDIADRTKDYVWLFGWLVFPKKIADRIVTKYKISMLSAYKQRSVFQYPYKHKHITPYVLTTEELATIFHFPGEVSQTPTFERISSTKATAPANLPI